jgi:ABC-type proline/glycine betaine transport system permease subunit
VQRLEAGVGVASGLGKLLSDAVRRGVILAVVLGAISSVVVRLVIQDAAERAKGRAGLSPWPQRIG